MEVVVVAVEVGRHHGQIVRAVLEVEALTELESCDLRYGIGLVRVLQWCGEELLLTYGLVGITRVDTRTAEEEQIPHTVSEGLADDILLDLKVVVDEVCPIGIVGKYPAHMCCG